MSQANQEAMQRAAFGDREVFRYRGPCLSHDWSPDVYARGYPAHHYGRFYPFWIRLHLLVVALLGDDDVLV